MQELTNKDLLLLQALADGETLRSFAGVQGISEQTAKHRSDKVKKILGADTIAQAIAMSLRRKLIE